MQEQKEEGAPLTGGPVDLIVRPVSEELRELAYERAGGMTSDNDGRYDPELLDVMCRGATEIDFLRDQIDRAAIACAHGESQIARKILLETLDA